VAYSRVTFTVPLPTIDSRGRFVTQLPRFGGGGVLSVTNRVINELLLHVRRAVSDCCFCPDPVLRGAS